MNLKIFLKILKIYSQINNIPDTENIIKELSIIKYKINNDKKKIFKQLLSERENDKKIILRKKYAELSREEKINNISLIEELNQKYNKFLMLKHPIINEYSDNYKDENKTKKTKKNKIDESDEPDEILDEKVMNYAKNYHKIN